MNTQQKLDRWAQENFPLYLPNIIVPYEDGFIVFGRYQLRPCADNWTVSKFSCDPITFSSKRSAVSWCVADKFRRFNLANRIISLDKQLSRLNSDIAVRNNLASKSHDRKFKDAVEIKLINKRSNYQYVMAELKECINSAKYLQLRGFSNETARTVRS